MRLHIPVSAVKRWMCAAPIGYIQRSISLLRPYFPVLYLRSLNFSHDIQCPISGDFSSGGPLSLPLTFAAVPHISCIPLCRTGRNSSKCFLFGMQLVHESIHVVPQVFILGI
jgi:hypothetical protein